ncbi:MAG: MFS transporter [Chloroflexi bacterium]|nr:MFS transporter [Chloroflexota bacterium]
MSEPRRTPRLSGLRQRAAVGVSRVRLAGQRSRQRALLLARRLAVAAEESLLGPRQALNERNLYMEALWFGVLIGISEAFLVVFVVRLQGTPFQIGLLAALPALVNIVLPIPAARFLESQRDRIPVILRATIWQRVVYMLLALVPFLGGEPFQVWAIILLSGLATLPAVVLNLGITVLISDIVAPRDRALVVSRRYVILSLTSALAALLGGWWLDFAPMPLNYQLLFGLGAAVSLFSLRYLQRMEVPPSAATPRPRGAGLFPKGVRRAWGRLTAQKAFFRFCLSAVFFHLALYLPAALFAIYRVRYLGANDRWIGVLMTVGTAAAVVGYFFWGRYARRWGEQRVLILSSAGLALFPTLTGLARSLPPLLGVAVISGIFSAGLTLGLFNTALALAPEDRRPTYLAVYTMLINIAAFVGPPLGSFLSEIIGIREVLYISGALRLLGAGLFVLALVGWPLRRKPPQEA